MRWKNLFILWFLAAVISVAAHDAKGPVKAAAMSHEEYSEEYDEEYDEYYETE